MKDRLSTTRRRKSKADLAEVARVGKDEMNLAEFPTAILTTRSNSGVKTLRFRDNHGQLTVTGSDALGLPTPIDTDVLVALIEMTKQKNNFTESKVNFTRYELIRLIGWANVGSSYDRLKESLDRWAGVLLIYDGCWWDNRLKRHVSKTVHIIEDIVIAEGRSKAEKDGRQQCLPLSSFSWSNHFMESFQANNLKSLDTSFYFSLTLPTSKQLFRFLDKRFANGRSEWMFDLETLAFEHIGLSRNYNAAKIKEKLGKGLEELEARGFLKPLPREERFVKAAGSWRIRLIDGRNQILPIPADAEPQPSPLAAELSKRGITARTAGELVASHAADSIQLKLEVFDWLVQKQDKRVAKSPEGYLVKSITDDYKAPKGFMTVADRQKVEEAKRIRERGAEETRRRQHEEKAQEEAKRCQVTAYWDQLDETARQALQAQADALSDLETLAKESGPLKRMGQRIRRETLIRRILDDQAQEESGQ